MSIEKKNNTLKEFDSGKFTCRWARSGPGPTRTRRLAAIDVATAVSVARSISVTSQYSKKRKRNKKKKPFLLLSSHVMEGVSYFRDGASYWAGCVRVGDPGQIGQLGWRHRVLGRTGRLPDKVVPHGETRAVIRRRDSNHPLEHLRQILCSKKYLEMLQKMKKYKGQIRTQLFDRIPTEWPMCPPGGLDPRAR